MSFDNKRVTLLFIQDYRSHEVLWKSDLKGYSNKQVREDSLRELSKKYNLSIKQVKKKIKSLRSYFWKEHQRTRQKKNGSGAADENFVSTWFAYKYLLFIAGINTPNYTMTEESLEFEDFSQDQLEDSQEHKEVAGFASVDVPVHSPHESTSSETYGEKLIRKKKRFTSSDARDEEANHFMQTVCHSTTQNDDEYTSFGSLVGHKVRKLRTSRLRAIAQNRITNLLFELEMSEENNLPHSSNISAQSLAHTLKSELSPSMSFIG